MFSVTGLLSNTKAASAQMVSRQPRKRYASGAALISTALLSTGLLGITTAPVSAQGYGYGYGYEQQWWKPVKPKRQKAKGDKRPDKAAKTDVAISDKPAEGPLVLVVSLRNQRVTVYDASGVVAVSPISSGRVGNPTPMGVYSILEKQKIHYSNLYDSAPMPNMQRITWSGVALHAGVLPGYPASHGCIRLPHSFSQRLYNMTKTGAKVIVTRDDAPVQAFSHQELFTAYPVPADQAAGAAPSGSSNNKVADASGRTVAAPATSTGLITAAAAETSSQAVSTAGVTPYRMKWLAEMVRRSQSLTEAQAAKAEAEAKIERTAQILEIALADLKAARAEAQALAQDIKKTEATRNATEKELDTFAKAMLSGPALTEPQALTSASREEALDSKLTGLTATLASQAEQVASLDANVVAATELAQSAEMERKASLKGAGEATSALKAAQDLVDEAKRREAKRSAPVAIFISRQTKKLYVRQGYLPILEAPVEIAEPDKPMGTHVFTAHTVSPKDGSVNWSVVSVQTGPALPDDRSNDKKRKIDAAKDVPKPMAETAALQTPAAALDRITIPTDVRDQIADVLKPGSSLIVSDYGTSNETGLFTDFIVSLR